jgi:hypothetical protein
MCKEIENAFYQKIILSSGQRFEPDSNTLKFESNDEKSPLDADDAQKINTILNVNDNVAALLIDLNAFYPASAVIDLFNGGISRNQNLKYIELRCFDQLLPVFDAIARLLSNLNNLVILKFRMSGNYAQICRFI